jgi:hypothetical protein
LAISHIYKDACSLAQAKGLPSLIYHEPALEVRFARGAAGTTSFLTIREQTFRRCSHSRPFMEPMQEAMQMTTAQAVGAASHTPGEFSIAVRIGCNPVSSRS